jgi:hypothetical protein
MRRSLRRTHGSVQTAPKVLFHEDTGKEYRSLARRVQAYGSHSRRIVMVQQVYTKEERYGRQKV